MTNESSANAIIGNTLRIIASGEYHPGAELTQKMASYIIELEQKLTDMAVQLANAESKCRELAAENTGLKNALEWLYETASSEGVSVPDENYSSVTNAAQVLSETPATDAFLAEVRAGAVDEVCLKISNAIINCYQDEQIGLDAAATICGDFTAQLRKGVQS